MPGASHAANKDTLKRELVAHLTAELEALERAHRATREGATHEEAKPENDKDTRALEQSYLARGQAMRVDEARTALLEVDAAPVRAFNESDPIGLGALVTFEDDAAPEGASPSRVWIALHGGGSRLADGAVQVVTTRSPLGVALLGRAVGEECEVRVAGRRRILTIVGIE